MTVALVIAGRKRRQRHRLLVTTALFAAVAVVFVLNLMIGNTFYGIGDVTRVVFGNDVPGASFTVGQLRLPRASLGLLAGAAFGVAGVTFQTMLRNPLASPDVIGISSGASAAAVVGIVTLKLNDSEVSLMALGGALLTALAMYLLASRGGFAGGRLVLIGIGFAAMLQSIIAYVLSRAAAWDLHTAMHWLTGSLNGATWDRVTPLAVVCVVFVSALAAVAGPIAARLVGPGAPLVIPAGLVGALLVLMADLVGQNALDHRYPVGVITGVLGAPYLITLLIALNRSDGSL